MTILNIAMKATFTEGYTYQDNLLSEYQHKLGHEVVVLTSRQTRADNGKIITVEPCDKLLDNGVRLIRISSGNKLSQILGYNKYIGKIIQDIKPDLIFIHGLCSFIPIQAINYKKKHPATILVADNHQDLANSNTTGFPFSQLLSIWRMGWRRWIRHFNHIYGTTSWRKDFAVDFYGIPENKAEVLLMGVDTDSLPSDSSSLRSHIRKELGIDDNSMVYIHGGKMCDNKKTIQVLDAFASIPNANNRLILFGSVDKSIESDFSQRLAKDKRIIYIGYIESQKVHQYFYAADFSLFPGLHSVLWEEAIGCGLPGVFRTYGKNDHTNICGNCINISSDAGYRDIAKIIQEVGNKEYYDELKQAAVKAAESMSYYDIARKSIRP